MGERMGHSTCERDPHPERGLPGDGTLMTPYPHTHGGEAPTFAGDVLPSRPAAGLQETGPGVLSNARLLPRTANTVTLGYCATMMVIAPGWLGSR